MVKLIDLVRRASCARQATAVGRSRTSVSVRTTEGAGIIVRGGEYSAVFRLGHGRARLQAADVRFAPSDERKERAVARPKRAYTGDERREEHGIGAAPVLSHYASVGKGHHLTEARRKHHMPPCGGRHSVPRDPGGSCGRRRPCRLRRRTGRWTIQSGAELNHVSGQRRPRNNLWPS